MGEGSGWDLRIHPAAAPAASGNLATWKSGNLEILECGDLGTWTSRNVGSQKTKILKIQIRSAQNVGKVWISREKCSWPYLEPSETIFSMNQKNSKNDNGLFSLVGQWAPIHPVWALAAIHPRWGNRLANAKNRSSAHQEAKL